LAVWFGRGVPDMTKYALYDPSFVDGPSPVTGWIDTDIADWTDKLPPATNLLELSESDWNNRLNGPLLTSGNRAMGFWGVQNGMLVPMPYPTPVTS
jgi:hypothetical protein